MATSENVALPTPVVRTPPSLADLSRRTSRTFFGRYLEGITAASPNLGPSMVSIHVNFLTRKITMTENPGGMAEPEGVERREAAKGAVEKMATVEVIEEGLECAICLKDLNIPGEVAKEMTCQHKYHSNCIEKWLGIHGSCPTCRYEMPVEEGDKDAGGGGDEEEEEEEVEHGGNSYENGVVFNFVLDGRSGAVYESATDMDTGSDWTDYEDSDVESDSVEHGMNWEG